MIEVPHGQMLRYRLRRRQHEQWLLARNEIREVHLNGIGIGGAKSYDVGVGMFASS